MGLTRRAAEQYMGGKIPGKQTTTGTHKMTRIPGKGRNRVGVIAQGKTKKGNWCGRRESMVKRT